MYRGIELMGQLIEQERLAIIKKRIYICVIIGWALIVIGTFLFWLNKLFIILAFPGLGLMIYASFLLLLYDKKMKEKIRREELNNG